MRLSYYHYFFTEARKPKAPRVCQSVLPIIEAYLNFKDTGNVFPVLTKDEEEVLMMKTHKSGVFMLVATREREIIKAVNTQTASCVEISKRLHEDEKAGFAAYVAVNETAFGLASTLRGPGTTVLTNFLSSILQRLGGARWKLNLETIGSSITLDQAKSMAFIARTTLVVRENNSLYKQLKELFSMENTDVDSFEIITRGKRKQNIAQVFTNIAQESAGEGRQRMKIRARAVIDEALSDFFIEEEGKMTDDLGMGQESEIITKISKLFRGHESLIQRVDEITEKNHYEQIQLPEIHRIGDLAYWNDYLRISEPSDY